MTPAWRVGRALGYVGDCRAVLRSLPAGSVQACLTSPPYFALRAYSGDQAQVWGEPAGGCDHEWRPYSRYWDNRHASVLAEDGPEGIGGKTDRRGQMASEFCAKCPAWKGALGLEPAPDLFIAHLVEIFREVRRVLRPDGVCFVNMGDSYAGSGKGQKGDGFHAAKHGEKQGTNKGTTVGNLPTYNPIGARAARNGHLPEGMGDRVPDKQDSDRGTLGRAALSEIWGVDPRQFTGGLKAKDLMGIPERLVLALQADGWWWRAKLPWIKRAAMPGSQTDRPTTTIEWVYMLTKSARCVWDADAVRKRTGSEASWGDYGGKGYHNHAADLAEGMSQPKQVPKVTHPNGRGFRDSDLYFDSLDLAIEEAAAELAYLKRLRAGGGVLSTECGEPLALDINPYGFAGAHFATYPARLIRPLLMAATSAHGACDECGAPWRRVSERVADGTRKEVDHGWPGNPQASGGASWKPVQYAARGWAPTCSHADAPKVPCTVLDPFGGAGTTSLVANQLGRRSVYIDCSSEYANMARRRLERDAPMMNAIQEAEVVADNRRAALFDMDGVG